MNWKNTKALYVLFLRYSPCLGVLAFICHYSLLMANVRTIMADYLFDTSLLSFLFIFISSKVYGFCRLHRCFITYIAVASLDIDLHHWMLIPYSLPNLIPALMVLAGTILMILLVAQEVRVYKQRGRHK